MSSITQVEPMLVVRRITSGITGHWVIRLSEWIMVYPAVAMGIALLSQPDMFDLSPSFDSLQRWADEGTWAFWVLMCAVIRLGALVVNGTFSSFKFSPHFRLAASFVGIAFWSQFTLGFLVEALYGQGAWSAFVAYSTLCLMELANIFRSSSDIHIGGKRRD